ncbi:MAG: serine/threonine-protein kinase, partial [Myxococcota bacterium]
MALLVEGYDAFGRNRRRPRSAGAMFSSLGQLLLACNQPRMRVTRLSPDTDEPLRPTPAILRSYIDQLSTGVGAIGSDVNTARSGPLAICVMSLHVTRHEGQLMAIAGSGWQNYPESATVPLSWVGQRLADTAAESLFMAIHAVPADDTALSPAELLRALAIERQRSLVVCHVAETGFPLLDVAFSGLRGDDVALDPNTGTITMASLYSFVQKHLDGAALWSAPTPGDLIIPPGLKDIWQLVPERESRAFSGPSMDRRSLGNNLRGAGPNDAHISMTGRILRGGFDLICELGSGGFGTVYRARQTAVGREVAVKVMHSELDITSSQGQPFLREIQSIGRLDHNNVVRIYHADLTENGCLFFAMEYLDGRSLQRSLDQHERWTAAQVTSIAEQVLSGLGAAHRAGIIHADVKPGNIMVCNNDSRAVLVDFGLAR